MKNVFKIADMDVDFSQWYTDVVKKAELADYSSIKGCMIIRPYGYAIWEMIVHELDLSFKMTGHENVYMPLFISEDLLQKEKDHIDGFAPEVAWVTRGGNEELSQKLCVRPTSETLFCEHYANIIKSYRDLPKLYNQWCSVVRWEKTTRPFLRSREFLWQEGHTAHATRDEALCETGNMLELYAKFFEDFLAIAVIKGEKTEKEKFAGAISTYSIEALMHDGQALQAATSHYFGENFAKVFNIQYLDQSNRLKYVHQTSWGLTTRLIGAVIMVHGDNNGLVLPPRLAPIQIIIIPISSQRPEIIKYAEKIKNSLTTKFRVKLDDSDKSPGWKFSEYEMRGVPLRIEIGPRDFEKGIVTLVCRHNHKKISLSVVDIDHDVNNHDVNNDVDLKINQMNLEKVLREISDVLDNIQDEMLNKSKEHLDSHIFECDNIDQTKEILEKNSGIIKGMWCGEKSCEEKVKSEINMSSRCILESLERDEEIKNKNCFCCGHRAKHMVCWGRAY